jgi:hypothetical protein
MLVAVEDRDGVAVRDPTLRGDDPGDSKKATSIKTRARVVILTGKGPFE